MKRLKPIRAKVELVYSCINCKKEFYLTKLEAEELNEVICTSCNRILKLYPIKGIKITPLYDEIRFVERGDELSETMINSVVVGLKQLGITKPQAKKFVKQCIDDGMYKTSGSFDKFFTNVVERYFKK